MKTTLVFMPGIIFMKILMITLVSSQKSITPNISAGSVCTRVKVFRLFLEELKIPKIHFEINCPLSKPPFHRWTVRSKSKLMAFRSNRASYADCDQRMHYMLDWTKKGKNWRKRTLLPLPIACEQVSGMKNRIFVMHLYLKSKWPKLIFNFKIESAVYA